MKALEKIVLFGTGSIIGFVSGGMFVVKKAASSDIIKQTMAEVASEKIMKFLYGKSYCDAANRNYQGSRKSYRVSYKSYYDDTRYGQEPICDDIVFPSIEDVSDIVNALIDIIDNYSVVTVADLYDLAGISSNYAHKEHIYGWTSIDGYRIKCARDGYRLIMPKPIRI